MKLRGGFGICLKLQVIEAMKDQPRSVWYKQSWAAGTDYDGSCDNDSDDMEYDSCTGSHSDDQGSSTESEDCI